MVDLLAEMLREAERGVDHQLKALQDLDGKSEHLLAIGLGALGAGVALATFALERAPGGLPLLLMPVLAAAAMADVGALLFFLDPYVGLLRRCDAFTGPSPRWLRDKANAADWRADRHVVTVIASYARYFEQNERLIARHRFAHRLGLLLLLGAVLAQASAWILILG